MSAPSASYLDLSRVQVRAAREDEHARCEQELAAHHYLPSARVVGERGWQIAECDGRWVALILWCAAAKRLKAREAWIGWDPRTQAERLKLVVQQARFCLLHAQPNLASRVLGESVRHLPEWWQQRHGYTPLLAETFVDPARFEGTCYRAAGWHEAGATTGHRRAGRDYYHAGEGLKSLWLKPLRPDAARRLRGPLESLPAECRAAQPVATMGILPVKLAQLESLHEAFARVPDPRARNRHHRLATVLTIAALGILMGRQRPADFLRLAQQLNARQREALGYYRAPGKKVRQAPGRDVFYTLLGRVDPGALAAVLNTWLQAQHGQLPSALALDGKAVTDRLAQVVSLVAQQTGATVAVAPVLASAKEHEVPAARALLAATDLTGTLTSLDAGHTNHETARTIVAAGGDYLLQLKDNAPAVRAAAAHALAGQAPLFSPTTATTVGPNTAS
jgi:Druantia protein DruA/DDE_Tnp_1-associated/Transposase DDE domain